MSSSPKRYRQQSIYESFGISKKPKMETQENDRKSSPDTHMRELMANAAESRRASSQEKHSPEASQNIQETSHNGNGGLSSSQSSTSSNEDLLQQNSEEQSSGNNSEDLFPDLFNSEEQALDFYVSCSIKNSVPDSPSPVLFPDDSNSDFETKPSSCHKNSQQVASSSLNRSPDCSLPLPILTPTPNHSIMFSPHILEGRAPRPFPSEYRDKWSCDYTRMPCSPESKYPVNNEVKNRWDVICQSLRRDIKSSQDLEQAIMAYNCQHLDKWNFLGLHSFFRDHLTDIQREYFFDTLLPEMVEIALNLPYICTQPIPLLKKYKDHTVTMSQKQIGCLLLNAFFCTFPHRNPPSRKMRLMFPSEYHTYPDINFNRLFIGTKNGISSKHAEKIKCLINYFIRIIEKEPTGTVTFHRQYLQNLPNWSRSTREFKTAVVESDGLIESDGHGMLQVDFANKYVGGGVLGSFGCVQEEIRFITCPELIVSRLFVQGLDATEVLIITGVEQYNKYSGYSDTFKWKGDFEDKTPRDSWGRRYTQLVAMDALHFKSSDDQYKMQPIKRELDKAYCGFYEAAPSANLTAVATGNWGCGAFNGSPDLKFLIQLMAASQANRDVMYFTFGNVQLKETLQKMHQFLISKNLSIGDLWQLLETYCASAMHLDKKFRPGLYEYLYHICSNSEEECKEEAIDDFSGDDSFDELIAQYKGPS